jgi:uncharacterized protein (TIGR03000 family)
MRRFNLVVLPTLALLVSVVVALPVLAGHGGGGHGGGHGGFHGFHGRGFDGYGGFYPGFGYGGFYPGFGYGYAYGLYPGYGYGVYSGYGDGYLGAGHGYPVAPAPVYVPVPTPATPKGPVEQLHVPPEPLSPNNLARIHVRVPANAQLWVADALTTQSGAQRDFHSPALTPGRTYVYVIKVRWVQDGQTIEQTRRVEVQANKTTNVNFLPARTTGSRGQEVSPRR